MVQVNRVAIVTAIYDQYDELKPAMPQQGADVDWVFVTDDDQHKDEVETLGWRVVYEPRPGVHPNRAAKHPKFLPWLYTDADTSIWVDGSFRVVSDRFAADVAELADPIAQFVHPWRDCLYDEASECRALAKYVYPPGLIASQSNRYRQAGHPDHWGLWATGVIARQHTEAVRRAGHAWLSEVYEWSFQDQISHPYIMRQFGLRPTPLPGSHLANGWLSYEGSARH